MGFSETFSDFLFEEQQKAAQCPSPVLVSEFFNKLLGVLFPEVSAERFTEKESFRIYLSDLSKEFSFILSKRPNRKSETDKELCNSLFDALPGIREQLCKDVDAMYNGDPAARSHTEVIRTYPGFYAIASYRIAHLLHDLDLHLIARIISSNAHSKTGIDIHPGAVIGSSFCIDHGTGIVIGETTKIGNFVKIYQGVTLGALSVRKQDALKKRHPNIGNHVVIYAGATILGGKTTVGDHSVIGGNVWVTESVPPHSKIYYTDHSIM
ncbi:MAG: serine acetyltransferase [Balneolales bacterium]|nr:serine acetyltransferase [Balneolales bacterium]